MISHLANPTIKATEFSLIFLSSILLGIWAVKETIALRNILLVCGSLISIYYLVQVWRHNKLKDIFTIWNMFPFVLLCLIFFWIVVHFVFFSVDTLTQAAELKSTWLRAFWASIVGLGTGLAIRNNQNRLRLLWLGIFISFLVLFYQYIPRALVQNKLLIPDYDFYIYHLKINAVLMGIILMVGVGGYQLDTSRNNSNGDLDYWSDCYWVLGTILPLYTFVYIIDSRNGIGLSFILYGFWMILNLVFFIRNYMFCPIVRNPRYLLTTAFGFFLVLLFVSHQMTVNKGWLTLLDDIKIAVQIDRYTNWKNPTQMGYPKGNHEQLLAANTYERVAWATVGLRAILACPQGVGVLSYPLTIHSTSTSAKISLEPSNSRIATHSGWIELGLAFGIPILCLIFSLLLITFVEALREPFQIQMTVLGLLVATSFLYLVGEVAIDHGLEILFYFLALAPAFILGKKIESLQDN